MMTVTRGHALWPATRESIDVLLEALLDGRQLGSPARVQRLLAAKAVELVGCQMGALRVPDPDGTTLRVVTVHGIEAIAQPHARTMLSEVIDLSEIASSAVNPSPRTPSAEAFLGGDIQVVPKIVGAAHTGFAMASMTAVPLIHAGHTLGVLTLYWRHSHAPDTDERDRLWQVGRRIAFTLDVAMRAETLRVATAAASAALEEERRQSAELGQAAQIGGRVLRALRAPGADPVAAVLDVLVDETGVEFAVDTETGSAASSVWSALLPGTEPETRLIASSPVPATVADVAVAAVAAGLDLASRQRADNAVAAGAALARLCAGRPAVAVADAAAMLGLLRAYDLILIVGECADDEAAYRSTRALLRSPLADGLSAATSVGRRLIGLCRPDGDRTPATVARWLLSRTAAAGVGWDRASTWQQLPETLERASSAAHLSTARGAPISASDMRGVADLAAALDPHAASLLADEMIEPLQAYDAAHRTELLATLRAYLAADGSAVATGERLHVHPNTVKQRIDRIERIVDGSLRDYGTIARLSLALSWHDVVIS